MANFGLDQNYDLLHTVVRAHRISTYNVIQIFFPLVVICLAQILTYFLPIKSDARISVCLSGLVATITFNFVVCHIFFAVLLYVCKQLCYSISYMF